MHITFALLILLVGVPQSRAASDKAAPSTGWDSHLAAQYLDSRQQWWQQWPRAQKDHGTLCISCHTVLPYALARPQLRRQLGEAAANATEQTMLTSIEARVSGWQQMVPFYSDALSGAGKTDESHATEAVLNAIILSTYDAAQGRQREITRLAFRNAFALQQATGPLVGQWQWQLFHLEPWESATSGYQGAAMFYFAALQEPGGYAASAEAAAPLAHLRQSLQQGFAAQPLLNQLYVLRAASLDPSMLSRGQKKNLLATLQYLQQSDGGWRSVDLLPAQRSDQSPEPGISDGYATAIAVLAMQAAEPNSNSFVRGITWLRSHQQANGSWLAESLNKKRDPGTPAYLFMSDAATGYAALALSQTR